MEIKKPNWKKSRTVYPTFLVKLKPQGGGASAILPPEYEGDYALVTPLNEKEAKQLFNIQSIEG